MKKKKKKKKIMKKLKHTGKLTILFPPFFPPVETFFLF